MFIQGSQRGGGLDLATHLLNDQDNDHVEVMELRGVASSDLTNAFLEIEASAACTRATNPFFSVQLCPPIGTDMERDHSAYKKACSMIEEEFPDLANQPRAIVFHEKNGRRHAHAVWSRIDTEKVKAVQLSHDWPALQRVSRAMFREYGLEMPKGYENSNEADPLNYTRQQWQQCKRIGEDPRDIKRIIQEAFQHSDSRQAFAAALEGHALMLARGDQRGFVMVHHSGEALGLGRYLAKGTRIKEMRERLGDEKHCITVDQAREQLRARMTAAAEKKVDDLKRRHAREAKPYRDIVLELRETQRGERQALKDMQGERTAQEELVRGQRLRKGLIAWWDRFTGTHGRVTKQNREEAEAAHERDLKQAEAQIKAQLEDRRRVQEKINEQNATHTYERNRERGELGHWLSLDKDSARHALQAHTAEIEQTKEDWKERQRHDRRDMRGLFKTEATAEQQAKKDAFRRDLNERDKRGREDKGPEREM